MEDIPALFPGGREDGPYDGKILCAVIRTKAAGDLLPQFHHPAVPFRDVVGEGHARIGEKAQYILFADTQAQQQILTNPPRLPAARFAFAAGAKQRGLCLMKRQPVGEDRVVTSLDQHDETRLQCRALLAREVRRVAGATQQTLHLARPVLSLDLDRKSTRLNSS